MIMNITLSYLCYSRSNVVENSSKKEFNHLYYTLFHLSIVSPLATHARLQPLQSKDHKEVTRSVSWTTTALTSNSIDIVRLDHDQSLNYCSICKVLTTGTLSHIVLYLFKDEAHYLLYIK